MGQAVVVGSFLGTESESGIVPVARPRWSKSTLACAAACGVDLSDEVLDKLEAELAKIFLEG